MPSKKKKYNARFPPARIKKIMQKDEEVGKVAAAVPVIISRALELFIENLITKASQTTQARHAKTLSTSHIKQVVLNEQQFDFLKDLVASVPDVQAEDEDGAPAGVPNPSITTRGRGRGRGRRPRSVSRDMPSDSQDNMDNGDTDDTEETDTGDEDVEESSSSSFPSSNFAMAMDRTSYPAALGHPAAAASYPTAGDQHAQPIDMTSSASVSTLPGATITQPVHMNPSTAVVCSGGPIQPLNMTASATVTSPHSSMVTQPVGTGSHPAHLHPAQMPPAPYTLPVRPPMQAVPFLNNNTRLPPPYYTAASASMYGHPSSALLPGLQGTTPPPGVSHGKQPLLPTSSSNDDEDYDS